MQRSVVERVRKFCSQVEVLLIWLPPESRRIDSLPGDLCIDSDSSSRAVICFSLSVGVHYNNWTKQIEAYKNAQGEHFSEEL